jgi:inorganic pyrophosphatase
MNDEKEIKIITEKSQELEYGRVSRLEEIEEDENGSIKDFCLKYTNYSTSTSGYTIHYTAKHIET